LLNTA